ncbi:hypothetical protein [Cohnella fermenti]|uniref:Uncharacterized protein n=1 Tax=Cohnella fermenti TaxID=2565925 RepID=A0A4S4BN61_9BACL|nr:hypothetical protein [Cohnella fermenti]THF75712.1 hypothetical protein E6C55_20875 [Cohnella fermenti]
MTLWSGEQARAVFASPDPDWAVFYAVFRRAGLVGSFRNGCIAGRRTRYHYYSLNGQTMNNRPWTDGALYVLPQERFVRPVGSAIPFEEWVCREPVAPLGKLGVAPDDFLYRNKVAVHPDGEPLVRTWLLYKLRACSIRCKR